MSMSIQSDIYFYDVWLTFKWAHDSNVCTFEYS